jgi:hypothetical protein
MGAVDGSRPTSVLQASIRRAWLTGRVCDRRSPDKSEIVGTLDIVTTAEGAEELCRVRAVGVDTGEVESS